MNKKGQIISLDFLISLIAVTLAIGLLIQFSELKTYNEKEEMGWMELKQVAETASDLLVSAPEITCDLLDESDNYLGNLNNCLVMSDNGNLTPSCYTAVAWGHWPQPPPGCHSSGKMVSNYLLAIPEDFKCNVSAEGGGLGGDLQLFIKECEDDPSGVKNVYSVSRKVVIFRGSDVSGMPPQIQRLKKSELEDCRDNNPTTQCPLTEATVTIQVWKE